MNTSNHNQELHDMEVFDLREAFQCLVRLDPETQDHCLINSAGITVYRHKDLSKVIMANSYAMFIAHMPYLNVLCNEYEKRLENNPKDLNSKVAVDYYTTRIKETQEHVHQLATELDLSKIELPEMTIEAVINALNSYFINLINAPVRFKRMDKKAPSIEIEMDGKFLKGSGDTSKLNDEFYKHLDQVLRSFAFPKKDFNINYNNSGNIFSVWPVKEEREGNKPAYKY